MIKTLVEYEKEIYEKVNNKLFIKNFYNLCYSSFPPVFFQTKIMNNVNNKSNSRWYRHVF